MEPLSVEDTAERFVRPSLRQVFVDLCRKPLSEYLARFEFESELLQGMYAVTDGFSGLNGGWDTPGTGMNFLIHNMCRLPGADGTWMIVKVGGCGKHQKMLLLVSAGNGHLQLPCRHRSPCVGPRGLQAACSRRRRLWHRGMT